MYPEVFHLPFLHTYGVLVALAFLTALWLAGRLASQAGLNADSVTNLGMYCALAGMGGAKLMMFLVDVPYYMQNPGEIFSLGTLQAGRVFYGGAIGGLARSARSMRYALLLRRLLLGRRVPPAVGGDVQESGGAPVGCAAWRAAPSYATLRSL